MMVMTDRENRRAEEEARKFQGCWPVLGQLEQQQQQQQQKRKKERTDHVQSTDMVKINR